MIYIYVYLKVIKSEIYPTKLPKIVYIEYIQFPVYII